MAKAKPNAKPKPGSQQDLKKLDREILKLANQRAKLWKQLASDAADSNAAGAPSPSIIDDQGLIDSAVSSNKGPLPESAALVLLRELQSASKSLVRKTRVAFLGPEQSYSYLATLQQFGTSVEFIPVATIEAVFEEVERRTADFGVVPLENSTDGRIADTLTMFVNTPLKICAEIPFVVHHCLLGAGDRSDIKKICSKPQALSQCRVWTAKHFPSAQMISMSSTAAAAKLAAEDKSVAAVASEQAAARYELKLLARNIEDNPNNITRFAVINHEAAARTRNDKTAVMFEILHQPGALADTMNVFKRSKLNMTWIESFPMPNSPNEYLFFVEMEGHQSDAKVKKALAALEIRTGRITVLGSYPAGVRGE